MSTEQEYDAPNEMIDDVEPDTPGPNPYSSAYPNVQQQQQQHQKEKEKKLCDVCLSGKLHLGSPTHA